MTVSRHFASTYTAAREKFVLVPEPARPDGGLTTGRYAIARFDLATTGKPSHAGIDPRLGRSAVREMARRIIEIDLLSVVRGCRLFLPTMLAAGRGQIVSTASFAGLAGAPGIMTYGVAKAAVVTLSEQLRAEVQSRGVRVSVLCPSFFRTNLCESGIGSPRVMVAAQRLMDESPDTLDGVADKVFAAAERGDFMIIPTRREPIAEDAALTERETEALLAALLADLSPADARMLELRLREGLTLGQIANRLDLSRRTVYRGWARIQRVARRVLSDSAPPRDE